MDVVAGRKLETHGLWRIRAHEAVSSKDWQFNVHHQIFVRIRQRRLVGAGRAVFESGNRSSEFRLKNRLVELKGGFGVTCEVQIGAYLWHDVFFQFLVLVSRHSSSDRY